MRCTTGAVSRRTSIAQLAAAYAARRDGEMRGDWACALIYRPVSFVLTPLFVAASVRPMTVTLLGLVCALLLPCIAWAGGAQAWPFVGAIGILFCVLDCVDGDVARVTGRTSARGAYADFATDIVYRISLYAAFGIVVDGAASEPRFGALAIALLAAVLAVTARVCRLYGEMHGVSASAGETGKPTAGGIAFSFLSGLDRLLAVAILVFGALGLLPYLLGYLLVYSCGDFVLAHVSVLRRCK